MHTVQTPLTYACICIQPADKAVKYLINSYNFSTITNSKQQQQQQQIESEEEWVEMNGRKN